MHSTKILREYPVILRACERLPLLVLVAAVLAISWLLRREPLF